MELIIRASAILIQDKKVLLCKRPDSKKVFPGLWGLPGGTLDKPGTAMVELVSKRVSDLTGFEYSPERKLWFYETLTEKMHVITCVYIGEFSGDLDINLDEVSEYDWFSYDDIEDLDLAFSYWEVIEDLHQEDMV